MTKILGIDPGNKGGLSICENGKIIKAISMPIHKVRPIKKEYTRVDFLKVTNFIKDNNIDATYIEFVSARPLQGGTSIFQFGLNFGGLIACIESLNIPLYMVMPQKWKKIVLGAPTADKEDAIKFCQQNCSDINLKPTPRCKVDSDGIADAICISVYGMYEFNINNK